MDQPDNDLRVLMKRLDALIAGARPVPLLRSQIVLDRESVFDVLDTVRGSLPEMIKTARWYRQKREEDGDPPLRDGEVISSDTLADVDAMDALIHNAPPVPLTDSVRVNRDRLMTIVNRLRDALVPLGQEVADYRSLYP